MIYRLNNQIKNYVWGCKTSLNTHFGFDNEKQEHQAELWMGAHPNGCSILEVDNGIRLDEFIKQSSSQILGSSISDSFGGLPFLMKVLAVDSPLSIQVHPSKKQAEIGYKKENDLGIEFSNPKRNYHDDNHKPEVVYALSDYDALNGFREFDEIIELFSLINNEVIRLALKNFKANKNEKGLKSFFKFILRLNFDVKNKTLADLISLSKSYDLDDDKQKIFNLVTQLATYYPGDIGLFSPLFLNLVNLKPGESMFLYAETPHAYLRGLGIEVMASSDNVLRAGLTPKNVDIDELINNTAFYPTSKESIQLKPQRINQRLIYPIPVNDFNFDILEVENWLDIKVSSAEILFCIDGSVKINECVNLTKGQSVFISAEIKEYKLIGNGRLARAYN